MLGAEVQAPLLIWWKCWGMNTMITAFSWQPAMECQWELVVAIKDFSHLSSVAYVRIAILFLLAIVKKPPMIYCIIEGLEIIFLQTFYHNFILLNCHGLP